MYRNYRLYPTYILLSSRIFQKGASQLQCSPAYCRGRFILGDHAIATTKIPVAGGCHPSMSDSIWKTEMRSKGYPLRVSLEWLAIPSLALAIHPVLLYLRWLEISENDCWQWHQGPPVLPVCGITGPTRSSWTNEPKKRRWLPAQLCDLLAYPKSFMDISMTK